MAQSTAPDHGAETPADPAADLAADLAPVVSLPGVDAARAVGDIADLVKHFAHHLKHRARKAPATVRNYGEAVTQLTTFLLEHGHPTDVADIERAHVQAFLDHLEELGRKPATVNNRYVALSVFFGWLEDENEIDITPMRKIKPPPLGEPAYKRHLTPQAIEKMVDTCDTRTFTGARDRAILRLFEATGLRIDELTMLEYHPDATDLDPNVTPFLNLNPQLSLSLHLSEDDMFVSVLGKGGGHGKRQRFVPFGDETVDVLWSYVRARAKLLKRFGLADHGRLWINARNGRPLGDNGITNIVTNAAKHARVGHVHPHLFRHAYINGIKELIDAGKLSVETAMYLTGHRNMTVFMSYGRDAKTQRVFKAFRNSGMGGGS